MDRAYRVHMAIGIRQECFEFLIGKLTEMEALDVEKKNVRIYLKEIDVNERISLDSFHDRDY